MKRITIEDIALKHGGLQISKPKRITVTLTEDQARLLKDLLYESNQIEGLSDATIAMTQRIGSQVNKALAKAKS